MPYTISVRFRTLTRLEVSIIDQKQRDLLKQMIFLNRGIRGTERRLLRKYARQHGLAPNELLLIDTLADFPNNSIMGLADILELNKSTVSTIAKQLINKHLVSQEIDPANHSRFRLNVTSRGRQLAEGIYDAYLTELNTVFSLDQLDLNRIKDVLTIIHKRID